MLMPENKRELGKTGCKSMFLADVYWVRKQFGWFVKAYSRKDREGCACHTCYGWHWPVLRMSRANDNGQLTPRSLLEMHLCPPEKLVYGGGNASGGSETELYKDKCLRGECTDCSNPWGAGLSMLQARKPCSWIGYIKVEEGTDKKGKPKKRLRERTQRGTARELETKINELLPPYMLHLRTMVLMQHACRETMRHSYSIWVDYSSRIFLANTFSPQSSEMSPQEIGAFCCVSTRPFGSKRSDNDQTIRDQHGRVEENHVILFDYNPGGGERAICSQASCTTDACLAMILERELDDGLDMSKCGHTLRMLSDNCCADLKCADHFGALDSWVNPERGHSPTNVHRVKMALGIRTIIRGHGCREHGKDKCDTLAMHHRTAADKLTLAWTPGEDVPEGKVEGAEELCKHMQSGREVETAGAARARITGYESVTKGRVLNKCFYQFLSVDIYNEHAQSFRRFKTVKTAKGQGSSTWHEYRFLADHPKEILSRDTLCGCDPCMETPPSPCQHTHRAGPFVTNTLVEKGASGRSAPVAAATAITTEQSEEEEDVGAAAAEQSEEESEEELTFEDDHEGGEHEHECAIAPAVPGEGDLSGAVYEVGTGLRLS